MENYVVRTARAKDLPTLLEFEQGIILAERPYDPTLDADPINYYDLAELISSDNAEVAVVAHGIRIVASGYALVKKAKPYLDHEKYSYLGFMYTDPEYRGKGLNKMIIHWLKEWSLGRGLKEIRLTVYDDNFGAVRAYEKAGFKKHLIEMRLTSSN